MNNFDALDFSALFGGTAYRKRKHLEVGVNKTESNGRMCGESSTKCQVKVKQPQRRFVTGVRL